MPLFSTAQVPRITQKRGQAYPELYDTWPEHPTAHFCSRQFHPTCLVMRWLVQGTIISSSHNGWGLFLTLSAGTVAASVLADRARNAQLLLLLPKYSCCWPRHEKDDPGNRDLRQQEYRNSHFWSFPLASLPSQITFPFLTQAQP